MLFNVSFKQGHVWLWKPISDGAQRYTSTFPDGSVVLNESVRGTVCLCTGLSPFLGLINDVTDLHVECPVFILQWAICGFLCEKPNQT